MEGGCTALLVVQLQLSRPPADCVVLPAFSSFESVKSVNSEKKTAVRRVSTPPRRGTLQQYHDTHDARTRELTVHTDTAVYQCRDILVRGKCTSVVGSVPVLTWRAHGWG